MRHLICLIIAVMVTVQGTEVVITGSGPVVVSIGIPGGALVIKDYVLVIEGDRVRLTEKPVNR